MCPFFSPDDGGYAAVSVSGGMPSIPSATLLANLAVLAQPSSASEDVDLGGGLGCNTSAEVRLGAVYTLPWTLGYLSVSYNLGLGLG